MSFVQALADRNLIYSAMNRAGITQTHPEFEDYFHEALLMYVEFEQQFATNPPKTTTTKNYIYSKLYWRLTDMLRRDWRYEVTYQQAGDLDENDRQLPYEEEIQTQLFDLLDGLKQQLGPNERRFLDLYYLADHSLTETCTTINISERTAYRIKRKIQTKAQHLAHQ
ncbi:sigma-70 family RNA polymerase sigma factor [Loigolactobacillus jiayinensis]|uniref:Sigma-70 family RNA polymerase sigma factor n=1 Tax=Loigolactobacillus jiayinensis TaxID=2486016 RepID=A0ABW1RDU5_9LACO|nr:sigma-70 family RNA polymerase sigma factor [Loigolactobacillus jiayinensis]